jgi:hypothetical protein
MYKIQTPASRSLTRVTDTWPWTAARQVFKNIKLGSAISLYGRQWDVHGRWNQPGAVLSAEHSHLGADYTIKTVNFKGSTVTLECSRCGYIF